MKKILTIMVYATAFSLPCYAAAQTHTLRGGAQESALMNEMSEDDLYEVDELETNKAPWEIGDVVAQGCVASPLSDKDLAMLDDKGSRVDLSIYEGMQGVRKFLGVNAQGYYIVQDFYKHETNKENAFAKLTEPYLLRLQEDVTSPISFNGLRLMHQGQKQASIMGPYTSYYFAYNKKCFDGYFKDGVPQGTWQYWDVYDYVWQGAYENGVREGVWVKSRRSNKANFDTWEGVFAHGEWQGTWTLKDSAGQIKEVRVYEPSRATNVRTYWYNNGQKASEGVYANDHKIGAWSYWYENGQKSQEGRYENNQKQGLWVSWHDNGQQESKGEYVNGDESGLWTYWHKNGQKDEEGYYGTSASKIGIWRAWDEEGELLNEENWEKE